MKIKILKELASGGSVYAKVCREDGSLVMHATLEICIDHCKHHQVAITNAQDVLEWLVENACTFKVL